MSIQPIDYSRVLEAATDALFATNLAEGYDGSGAQRFPSEAEIRTEMRADAAQLLPVVVPLLAEEVSKVSVFMKEGYRQGRDVSCESLAQHLESLEVAAREAAESEGS